jgi:hypothetical protein
MSEKGTGALTGLTTFLLLAFIIPGVVYLAFILLLFDRNKIIAGFMPGVEFGTDVAVGAVVVLGLVLTSIVFPLEMLLEWVLAGCRTRSPSLTEIIFSAEKNTPITWYFWQLWGQMIMHLNIAGGLAIIYFVYKISEGTCLLWQSWKDLTLIVIAFNVACWLLFRNWHSQAIGVLKGK